MRGIAPHVPLRTTAGHIELWRQAIMRNEINNILETEDHTYLPVQLISVANSKRSVLALLVETFWVKIS